MRCVPYRMLHQGPIPGETVDVQIGYQSTAARAWLQGGDASSNLRVELYSGGGKLLSIPWAGGTGGYTALASQGFTLPTDCAMVRLQNQAGPGNVALCILVEYDP